MNNNDIEKWILSRGFFFAKCEKCVNRKKGDPKMSENIDFKNIGKKEYVEKESLAKHIDNSFGEISTPFVVKEIRNFPVSDVVEVRHGKYHNTRFTDGVFYQEQCSICGEWTYEYSKNYCSNCGAKMDGERRNENERT